MKNILNNSRIAAVALVALFSVGLNNVVLANEEKKSNNVEIRFIGNHNNQPVLELNFINEAEGEYVVEIVDEYNVLLYKDVVKANAGTRRYMLNTEELGNVALRFQVTGKKSNKTTVFQINRNARVIEDVVVNRVK